MHAVTVWGSGPMDAVEFRNQLIQTGLMMNHDFVWKYVPPNWDNYTRGEVIPRHVVFEFVDPALATFYQLKWGSNT